MPPASHGSSFYRHFNGLVGRSIVYPDASWDYEIRGSLHSSGQLDRNEEERPQGPRDDRANQLLPRSLPLAINRYPNADVQLGVNATDAGSDIILLELGVSVHGGPVSRRRRNRARTQPKDGSPAWCPWSLAHPASAERVAIHSKPEPPTP
ncbi:MAG: hypothetical protein R2873_30525 [Caldilineaceae bacterium]